MEYAIAGAAELFTDHFPNYFLVKREGQSTYPPLPIENKEAVPYFVIH